MLRLLYNIKIYWPLHMFCSCVCAWEYQTVRCTLRTWAQFQVSEGGASSSLVHNQEGGALHDQLVERTSYSRWVDQNWKIKHNKEVTIKLRKDCRLRSFFKIKDFTLDLKIFLLLLYYNWYISENNIKGIK